MDQLKKEFLEILDKELRQWIDIHYEVEKGFASLSLYSQEPLNEETMYETFYAFKEHLELKQVHFVGVIHTFNRTTYDYQIYDDADYTEYGPKSEEEKNKLINLLNEIGARCVTEDCIEVLKYGHIDELVFRTAFPRILSYSSTKVL